LGLFDKLQGIAGNKPNGVRLPIAVEATTQKKRLKERGRRESVSRPPICKTEDTGAAQFELRLNRFSSAGGVSVFFGRLKFQT
jgi:hypothetical protein